ncbi:MAG: DUF222 domain-containing protein [Gemmatimonadota bacterium]
MIRAASASAAISAACDPLARCRRVGPPPLFLVREEATSYAQTHAERTTPCEPATRSEPRSISELDAIEELSDEITTLAAHIHAATHRLWVLLGEFDRRRGWELDGHQSCAHWLAFRTGIDLGAARERVRTARSLASLPETGASMARGELSFSQVRALSRVATPDNEGDLLDLARGTTVAQLERLVRGFRRGSRRDEAAWERGNHESRTLSVFPDEEGMYVLRGRIEPEVAAVLMRAIDAAGDALFREGGGADLGPDADRTRAAAQRRADALGLVAERALAAGFTSKADAPISGSRAARYQVVLHVDTEGLAADGEGGERHLEDGTRVSGETSRRLACDASVVDVTHDADGSVLDVGRRTRTIPPALRRALEVRDRGCRFPGCGSRFTDAHHVKHWADGGETNLGNTVLACHHHHRLLHEGGWRVVWRGEGVVWRGEGRAIFVDPRGREHFDGGWRAPEVGPEAVDALVEDQRRRGIDPDWRTAGARWKREDDIPHPVWVRAMEAVG